jgi:hypothetical protein
MAAKNRVEVRLCRVCGMAVGTDGRLMIGLAAILTGIGHLELMGIH